MGAMKTVNLEIYRGVRRIITSDTPYNRTISLGVSRWIIRVKDFSMAELTGLRWR